MHTKQSLCQDLQKAKIYPNDTVIMHFSMKAIGSVEGGAEGVLDALMTYFQPGLLVLPALTWANVHAEQPIFDPLQTPCCVGLLPEMFRKRMGVVRSWHPTHSVAAYGADAAAFCAGNERCDTPCARTSPWGKLLDRGAKIALVGCTLTSCTFLHGVEEWADVPGRLEE
ncbi:MAG: AAC(3) family N-acetyltransferase, partial [Clostridia bacterium]